MNQAQQQTDLHCYRVMVIEEYFAGDIPPDEMRILLADDAELEAMFHDEILRLQRESELAGLRAGAWIASALIFAGIAICLFGLWVLKP